MSDTTTGRRTPSCLILSTDALRWVLMRARIEERPDLAALALRALRMPLTEAEAAQRAYYRGAPRATVGQLSPRQARRCIEDREDLRGLLGLPE